MSVFGGIARCRLSPGRFPCNRLFFFRLLWLWPWLFGGRTAYMQGVRDVDHVGAEAWQAVQSQAGRSGEVSGKRRGEVMKVDSCGFSGWW